MNDKTEKQIRDYLWLLSLSGVVVSIDQWTKWLVRTNLPFRGTWLPSYLSWLSPYARIVHWANSGAAFGSFQNSNQLFIILSFVVIGLILYFYSRIDASDWSMRLGMGLYMSGVAGNLADRVLRGAVTDFISIGSLAVFNLADAVISIAVLIVIIGALNKERDMLEQENGNTGDVDGSISAESEVNFENESNEASAGER